MFYFFQTIGKNGMKLFTIAVLCVSQNSESDNHN